MENKYAILLECDPGTTLGGSCTRDVKNMANFLINNNFIRRNIYILSTSVIKTDVADINYEKSINFFDIFNKINDKKPTFLIVLLSGHGFSIRDNNGGECDNGDEIDGLDEAINIGKMIRDDDIYNNMIKKINYDAIMLADTCHSGTMFDLPYVYDGNPINKQTTSKQTLRKDDKENNYNSIISLSACNDKQLSMCDVGDNTGFGGSLTTSILNLDGVLNKLLNMEIDKELYNKIQNRLNLLNQKLVISCSKSNFIK